MTSADMIPASVLKSLDRTRCGVLERAANRAWHAPPSRLRETWLMLERYRRQRPLPAGATSGTSFLSSTTEFPCCVAQSASAGTLARDL